MTPEELRAIAGFAGLVNSEMNELSKVVDPAGKGITIKKMTSQDVIRIATDAASRDGVPAPIVAQVDVAAVQPASDLTPKPLGSLLIPLPEGVKDPFLERAAAPPQLTVMPPPLPHEKMQTLAAKVQATLNPTGTLEQLFSIINAKLDIIIYNLAPKKVRKKRKAKTPKVNIVNDKPETETQPQ